MNNWKTMRGYALWKIFCEHWQKDNLLRVAAELRFLKAKFFADI